MWDWLGTSQAVRVFSIALLILAAIAAIALINQNQSIAERPTTTEVQRANARAVQAIRLSQYKACLHGGNTFRNQVRDEFVTLKTRVLIPVFSSVAQLGPESPASRILEDSVDYMRHRIRTIDRRIPNSHCIELYPPLPGQEYPPRVHPDRDSP